MDLIIVKLNRALTEWKLIPIKTIPGWESNPGLQRLTDDDLQAEITDHYTFEDVLNPMRK